ARPFGPPPAATRPGVPAVARGLRKTPLRPSQDTFVRDGSFAERALGNQDKELFAVYGKLEVKSVVLEGYNRDAYLMFDLGRVPAADRIRSARLLLYGRAIVGDNTPPHAIPSLRVCAYRLREPDLRWQESKVMWKGRPVIDKWDQPDGVLGDATFYTAGEGWSVIDLTDFIAAERKAKRWMVTVALHVPKHVDLHAEIHSSEASEATRPRLEIEHEPG
ncbi:MAG: hypothetical protein AVDCRST_MAG64-4173, partial [uncultured Phycisphaerae bacterium]